MSSKILRRSSALAALATLAFVGACGDDPIAVEVIEEAQFAESLGIDLSAMTKTASGLYIETIAEGTGDPAGAGNTVAVTYTGWLSDGSVFDNGSFSFQLARGQVVPGFDEGVEGMRANGIRRIVIPPSLGYGSAGSGPVPPGAIMIFRIEVDSVEDIPTEQG